MARAFALASRVRVAEIHGQHHVLQHGQRRQQLEELEDDAHAAAAPLGQLVLAQLVHRRAADEHLAAGRPVDAGDHVDQRRLAAARLADHGDELTRPDLQIDVFERGEVAGRGAEHLAHLAQLDEMVLVACAARAQVPAVGEPFLTCVCAIIKPPATLQMDGDFHLLVCAASGEPCAEPAADDGQDNVGEHQPVDRPPLESAPDRHGDGQQDAGDEAREWSVGLGGAGCHPPTQMPPSKTNSAARSWNAGLFTAATIISLRRRPTHLEAQHHAIADLQEQVDYHCDENADDDAEDDPAPFQGGEIADMANLLVIARCSLAKDRAGGGARHHPRRVVDG